MSERVHGTPDMRQLMRDVMVGHGIRSESPVSPSPAGATTGSAGDRGGLSGRSGLTRKQRGEPIRASKRISAQGVSDTKSDDLYCGACKIDCGGSPWS